ncbi:MAG: YesL family protein [Eubacterium sp.]|nr:YesL family protein [Eubacterium sp.]
MADNDRGSGRQREWKLKKGLDAFGNMFGLNLCFILGCIPVITIGASLAATYATAIRLQENEEETILSCYIREFKRNFKQATLGFLALLVAVAVLLAEWLVVNTQTGAISLFYTVVFYLGLLFLSLILAFFFPMIARYHTTLKQAVKNSILLSVGYFWSWLKITVAWVAPVAFSIIYPIIFLYTWYLWLLLIFGMIIWGTSHSIRFVFNQNAEALLQSEEEAAEAAKKKEQEKRQKEGGKQIIAEAEGRRSIEKAADDSDSDDSNSGGSDDGSSGGRKTEKEHESVASTSEGAPEKKSDGGNSANHTVSGKNGQNRNSQNRNNPNKNNPNKSSQNKNGQNKNGQNKNTQNKNAQNDRKKKLQNRYYPAAKKTGKNK